MTDRSIDIVGGTVRRPRHPWTATVHQVLIGLPAA